MQPWSRRSVLTLAATGALGATVTACGTSDDGGGGGAAGGPDTVRIMVPNSPGGGYDTTARVAAKTMEDEKVLESAQVYNVEGAGGTVGLARTVQSQGKTGELMLMGLGVVGSVFTQKSEATLADTTPIARLISEPDAVYVSAESDFSALGDLVSAWKKSPKDFPVGGGSSPGGPDHLAPHLMAEEIGIDPTDVNYVSYDGGGPMLAALLGGEVQAAFAGISEYKDQVEAGQVRVLAITSAEPVPGFKAPTLKAEGVDLDFFNWRGLVAPPGLSEEETRGLITTVEELHDTEGWKQAMKENGWTDAILTGKEFGTFLKAESDRVEKVLDSLGLLT